MKKFLYLAMCLLMVASLCVCFVACGDDEEPTDPSNESSGTSSSVSESNTDSSKPAESTPSVSDSSKPAESKPEGTDSSKPAQSEGTEDSTGKSETVDSTESSADEPGTTDTSNNEPGTTDTKDEPGDNPDTPDPQPPVEEHEHTYSTTLTYDDKCHYYAATCEHTDLKMDEEEHSHDASTGNCKCGHHVHVYSTELSYDVNNHFYKAVCEHTEEITGAEPHSFNDVNECKCGRINDDLSVMIAELIKNKEKITHGTSTQTNTNVIDGNEVVSGTTVTYVIYDNYTYIKVEGDYIDEYYYSYNDGKLIAIQIQNGGKPFVDENASEESKYGARYGFACLGDYETYVCGVESLIKYFYNNAIVVAANKYEVSKENNVYTLSYAFGVEEEDKNYSYYYVVNMEFTVDESTTTIDAANITVERYSSDNYTVVDGEYVLKPNAEYNYHTSYVVTQTTEANEEVKNPYDASQILLDNIAIKDKDGNDIESVVITQRADEPVKLFLTDIEPSTAMLDLCDISIIVTDEGGVPVNINLDYNSYNNSYSFFVTTPGSYTVMFKIDEKTVTTTLEMLPKLPVSMSVQVYDFVLGEFNKTKRANVYTDTELYFTSYVDAGCDGEFIAKIVSGNITDATITTGEIGGKTAAIFKASAMGEYVIEISSARTNGVTAQFTVTVTEAPTIEEILTGKYFKKDEFGKDFINVEFDTYEDVAYIVVSVPDHDYDQYFSTIEYTIDNGSIQFTTMDVEGSDDILDDIYVNSQYQLVLKFDSDLFAEEIVLEKLVEEAELVSSGKMTVEDVSVDNGNRVEYAFELYSTGEFVFYKNYSKTRDVGLSNRKGAYLLRRMGKESVTLVKTNGDADALAGEYLVKGDVKVVITVDDEATYVKEPTYGAITIVDHSFSSSENSAYNFTYGYEIIDDEFVIYRYNVVTEEVQLIDLGGGEYSFLYPGVLSAQILEKIEGGDDVLGGKYVIEVDVSMVITLAEITIVPGATAPDRPIVIEKEYGAIYIEDHDGNATDLTGTYYYEIVGGGFVIYDSNGAVTTDFIITANPDGTYSFQCNGIVPQVMIKDDGVEGGLEGSYIVNGVNDEGAPIDIFYVSFVPGKLEEEEKFGTLVIEDKNNGSISGSYYYEVVEGGFVFYKADGNKITNEFYLLLDMDGETYTFQTEGFYIPQPLVKVEGISVLLGGKYTVSGEESDVAYEFTFAPGVGEKPVLYVERGTLEIVDNNTAAVSGSYTYAITDEGAIHIFKDGELTNDVIVSVGMNGGYIFKCAALQLPRELVKGKGEAGMLSGKYYVYNEGQAMYELLFLADGYEMPTTTEQAIVLGENIVVVNDAVDGVTITYTAEAFGNVTITDLTDGKIVVAYIVTQNGTDLIPLPSSFKLQEGQTVTLLIKTSGNSIDTVKLKVEFSRNSDTELGDDEF